MNNEYVIINRTKIEERIKELEKEINFKKIGVDVQRMLKHELKQILSESNPLIP